MNGSRVGSEHGIVLGIVIMTAVIFSIAAYAMLMTAMNQRQRAKEFDVDRLRARYAAERSEEHTSELQSRYLISYAVFCLKKKNK